MGGTSFKERAIVVVVVGIELAFKVVEARVVVVVAAAGVVAGAVVSAGPVVAWTRHCPREHTPPPCTPMRKLHTVPSAMLPEVKHTPLRQRPVSWHSPGLHLVCRG